MTESIHIGEKKAKQSIHICTIYRINDNVAAMSSVVVHGVILVVVLGGHGWKIQRPALPRRAWNPLRQSAFLFV